MSRYQTLSGSRISIGAEIGKGGEGTVYAISGSPDLVAKIYTDGRAEDRRNKIEAMVGAGLHRQAAHISFPIEILLDEKNRFVGFTMRKVKDALPIHQLWNSRDRQEKFPDATVAFMVRVAANVVRAVAELHHTGCVIGDINESGFLVTKQATVILIDSDSIQYSSGSRVFPCVVGTPEYLPPEHQGVNQRSLGPRGPNHDNFGAAVMIFRLLMSGTHPFGGIWKGRGDPPARPKWIEEFRYAYGAERHRLNVEPQPSAPPIDWLSDEIRSGFDRAFGRSGVQQRPSANDWVQILDQFDSNLAQCRKSPFHQHRQNANSCPWCETEQKRKTELFGKPKPSFQQKPFAQSTTTSPNAAPKNNQRARPSPPPPPRPSPSPTPKAASSAAVGSSALVSSRIIDFGFGVAKGISIPIWIISFILNLSFLAMMVRNQLQQAAESPDVGLEIFIYVLVGVVFHILSIPAIIYFAIISTFFPSIVTTEFMDASNSPVLVHFGFWVLLSVLASLPWLKNK
jgi:DNA-binding helix-hairpin-helix protein with protein kinase domain